MQIAYFDSFLFSLGTVWGRIFIFNQKYALVVTTLLAINCVILQHQRTQTSAFIKKGQELFVSGMLVGLILHWM